MDLTPEELDEAINALQEHLNQPMTPQEGRLMAVQDQQGAALRDMDSEDRDRVVQYLTENTELSQEEAQDWVRRMSEEEDGG
jgi:uncharacterized protein YeeX (DUF496 family)